MGGPSSSQGDQAQPTSSSLTVTAPPSPFTLALLSLTQDITALVSLSLEATASLVHDWFRTSLLSIGIGRGQVVRYVPPAAQSSKKGSGRGESGRGLAVVVVGAEEGTSISQKLSSSLLISQPRANPLAFTLPNQAILSSHSSLSLRPLHHLHLTPSLRSSSPGPRRRNAFGRGIPTILD